MNLDIAVQQVVLAAWTLASGMTATAASEETVSLAATSKLASAGSAIQLAGLTIHGGDRKFIEATGQVCLSRGILEFVAVEQGGRDYESVITLNCKPSALKFALLLIGCQPGPAPNQAKEGQQPGDPLSLEVDWEVDGKRHREPVERFLLSRATKKPPARLPWFFSGSKFVSDFTGREVFLADVEKAFISLWWSSAAIINIGKEYGIPYQGDDLGFEVNSEIVPPKGTPIKLMLRKHQS